MVRALIRRIFGGSDTADNPAASTTSGGVASLTDQVPVNGSSDPLGFVDFVVKSLVANRDEVNIESVTEEQGEVIRIHCAKDDVRKIIGRNGRTINAIRGLVRIASRKSGQKSVKVVVCE